MQSQMRMRKQIEKTDHINHRTNYNNYCCDMILQVDVYIQYRGFFSYW